MLDCHNIFGVTFVAQNASERTRTMSTSRIELDRPRCEGHGLCEEAAPELMHLDDDDELVIDQPEVGPEDLQAAQDALRVCPVAALKLV